MSINWTFYKHGANGYDWWDTEIGIFRLSIQRTLSSKERYECIINLKDPVSGALTFPICLSQDKVLETPDAAKEYFEKVLYHELSNILIAIGGKGKEKKVTNTKNNRGGANAEVKTNDNG